MHFLNGQILLLQQHIVLTLRTADYWEHVNVMTVIFSVWTHTTKSCLLFKWCVCCFFCWKKKNLRQKAVMLFLSGRSKTLSGHVSELLSLIEYQWRAQIAIWLRPGFLSPDLKKNVSGSGKSDLKSCSLALVWHEYQWYLAMLLTQFEHRHNIYKHSLF